MMGKNKNPFFRRQSMGKADTDDGPRENEGFRKAIRPLNDGDGDRIMEELGKPDAVEVNCGIRKPVQIEVAKNGGLRADG